jgi:hypothetical protein
MHAIRHGVLAVGILFVLTTELAAQHYQARRCDAVERSPEQLERERQLALRLAPILRFAPNARYFPTLPFFTALDGVDNDEDGLVDMEDQNEVTLTRIGQTIPSWTLLNQAYTARLPVDSSDVAPPVPPSQQIHFGVNHSSVLYRVCNLEPREVRELFRFLKSDEQAWKRLQVIDSVSEDIPDSTAFQVIQYYFYYVRDTGLEGHPEDIEMVFVFVPMDPSKGRQFRIVVGSGHSERTPNNVLVLFAPQMGLDSLNDSLNIIVEGGGHSSAPDMPPYGQFTPGVDVNWNIYDVWGTRDVQAVAGVGFTGHYRPEMTFARDGRTTVILFPSTYSEAERMAVQQQQLPEHPASDSTLRSYRLLPVYPFMRLSQALEDTVPDLAVVEPLVATIQRLTAREAAPGSNEAKWIFTGFDHLSPEQRRRAVQWMRSWNQGMVWNEGTRSHPGKPAFRPSGKHQVWQHDGYLRDPTNIFKSHLFRPTMADVSSASDVLRLLTWGVNGYPDDAYELYAGFVVPAIPFVFRLPGYSEIQAGVYRPNFWAHAKSSFSLAWVWEDHRNRLLSWYRKVSFIPHRAEVLADDDAADVGLGIGVSILPYIQAKSGATDPVNALRIRAGLRIDVAHPADALKRVGWEIGLQFRQ